MFDMNNSITYSLTMFFGTALILGLLVSMICVALVYFKEKKNQKNKFFK